MAATVLVVDDDRSVAGLCRLILTEAGHTVSVVDSAQAALAALELGDIDVVLSDVRMPVMDGLALLKSMRASGCDSDVVLMTAYATVESAVEAVKLGAYDYIEKPFSADRLRTTIQRVAEVRAMRVQNSLLKFRLASAASSYGLVGRSPSMLAVFAAIVRAAERRHPVLISGETGTGKELIARAIHGQTAGGNRPFVAVDCGALSPSIIESELFGHVRGAYTGAVGERQGLLASSAGGTLFLDEIGELPLGLQAKLLRAVQDREIRPLGGDKTSRFDGRVIAATNRDLERAVAENAFRSDLYFRLNVYAIQVPPLRARKDDIPLLIQHFIAKHGEGRVLAISRESAQALTERQWPGNVRELENCLIRMIAGCERRVLEITDIPDSVGQELRLSPAEGRTLEEAERAVLVAALRNAGGNVGEAAKGLRLSRATLYRKLNAHGLKPEKARAGTAARGGVKDRP